MSTIRVSKVESAESPSNNIELTSSGIVVSGVTTATNIDVTSINNLNYPTSGPLSNRNLIINGAMQVAQRGTTGISQNGNNNWVVDRFKGNISGQATITHSQETTGAPDGFQNWLKVAVTTADSSLASNEYGTMENKIEGYDFAQTRYGNSDAQDVTVSFKFKTNKAGTYCMIHRNEAANRNYLHEFTPVADGNWQTITYTVPGDTGGTWNKINGIGWRWELCIGNGTAFQSSTVGSWFDGQYYHSTPNQVNFLDSTSNELGITGVQVEVGSRATPFEHESYPQTLAKCMRYYQRLGNEKYVAVGSGVQGGTTSSRINVNMLYPMRDGPTLNYSNLILTDRTVFDNDVTAYSDLQASPTGVYANFQTTATGGALGRGILLTVKNNTSGYLELKAEL